MKLPSAGIGVLCWSAVLPSFGTGETALELIVTCGEEDASVPIVSYRHEVRMHVHDPFEESLRDLLKASLPQPDDDARLGRVLKTANRQVGAGDLFGLIGYWLEALMIGINNGSSHLMPVSRRSLKKVSSADKAG